MIRFYRYEIRSMPGQTPLTVFAPNWEQAEQREDFKAWFDIHKPRSIQITEHQYWDRTVAEDRYATADEVSEYVQTGGYAKLTQISPLTHYRHYGDHSILDPLKEKLTAEYEQHLNEWRELFNQDRESFYDRLPEICTMRTVYGNITGCMDYYPTEYMKALSELPKPLAALSEEYGRHIGYNIEAEVSDILAIAEKDDLTDGARPLNPDAVPGQSHEERMQCLQNAIDAEYADFEQVWHGLDFDDTMAQSMKIFSVMQLHGELKRYISQYPDEQTYALGAFKEPLAYDMDRLAGERDLRMVTVDEMNYTLAMMLPEVQTEQDIWGLRKNNLSPAFAVKEGTEQECYEFIRNNRHDGYSAGVLRYMNRWASMMETEMAGGATVAEAAERTNHTADTEGITGFMYGCAVRGLCNYWQYGEDLRQWHNQQYGYNGDGLINPAIIRISEEGPDECAQSSGESEDQAPTMQM